MFPSVYVIDEAKNKLRPFFATTAWVVVKRGIPWGIAGGIFYFLFREYPPRLIIAALGRAHIGGFVVLAVAYFYYVLYCDTWATARTFSRFTKRVTIRDLLPARMATYPISVLNYGAGQATFAYYIHRKRRIPLADVFGIFFLILITDLLWIIALAFAGSFLHDYRLTGVPLRPIVRGLAGAALCAIVLHLAFWRLGRTRFLSHLPFWNRCMEWMAKKHLVRIFREATLADYGRLALRRLPIHAMFPVAFFVAARLFGAHVPLLHMFGTVPIVILIGTIPVTPGGLGTTNAAFVEMLSPFVLLPQGGDALEIRGLIFAVSLVWMFANYFQKALMGTLFLARMPRDVFRDPPLHTR